MCCFFRTFPMWLPLDHPELKSLAFRTAISHEKSDMTHYLVRKPYYRVHERRCRNMNFCCNFGWGKSFFSSPLGNRISQITLR